MSETGVRAKDTTAAAIGRRLAAIREHAGLSQLQMAQRTGIPLTAWNNYERAVRRISIPNAVKVVAAVPGVSLDYIYLGRGESEPHEPPSKARK